MSQKRANESPLSDSNPSKKLKEDEEEIPAHTTKFGHEFSHWLRPKAQPLNSERDTLIFQQVEIEYSVAETVPKSFEMLKLLDGNKVDGCTLAPMPVVRIYGVNSIGNSICCNVYGYTPYLYIKAPDGFTDSDCDVFRQKLNEKMKMRVGPGLAHKPNQLKDYVVGVRIVKKLSLKNYIGEELQDFLQIYSSLPKHIPVMRAILESDNFWDHHLHPTFESDILFVLRFMVDMDLVGCCWVKIPQNEYVFTSKESSCSTCQYEVDVFYNHVVSLGYENEWAKIAPWRTLSFDIECMNRKGSFPDPEHDAVITIANQIKIHGDSAPFVKNVFTLGTCSQIIGSDVLTFKDERHLLEEWSEFVNKIDPDVFTGYNIANFDFPYLINRASRLKLKGFTQFSRLKDTTVKVKESKFSSRAFGTRESKELACNGRITLDMLQVIQRDYKLRSYSLNSVSAVFLGDQKEEVHYSAIASLFSGSDDDRRRIAVYCLKDAWLPLRLMDHQMALVNYTEMARVTGIPLSYLLPHGQQIKVISQLYREANKDNLLVPFAHKVAQKSDEEDSFEGAVVIEPKKGFHELPIATLDFSSLYPSVMIAHNICYSTLISQASIDRLGFVEGKDYEKTPKNCFFVKSNIREGILPRILRNLLSSRKKAKAELAKATDESIKAVLEGRQLALKVSANSVYGFTGAQKGKLPCVEIAASVTSYGREMINFTANMVTSHFNIQGGYAHDSTVIYGDTDSVMVNFFEPSVGKTMELGAEAAVYVTQHFPKPISLEFEKVYYPYLLISKKRYAGMFWVKPDKPLKMDTKGIESVRRDNCTLVKHVVDTCLNLILRNNDINGAISFVKQTISDLLRNKLDLSLLVISKALSKEGKNYAAKQAHVELAKKMHTRDSATAPTIGDRVPYVIVQASTGAKTYEKAEDPLFVLEKSLPLDYNYYIEHQLKKPVTRIFKAIINDCSILFHGEHTRTLSVTTPSVMTGGIMRHAIKSLRCLGCRVPLQGEQTLCSDCKNRETEIYHRQLLVVNQNERHYDRIFTQCQKCMGSIHQPVICTNRDCPIFYMRSKVRKDLIDSQETLNKFDIEDLVPPGK